MNVFEPNVAPNGRYDTNTTCTVLGVGRSTLNRYRKAGLIRPRLHKANSRPYYIGAEITKLWQMIT